MFGFLHAQDPVIPSFDRGATGFPPTSFFWRQDDPSETATIFHKPCKFSLKNCNGDAKLRGMLRWLPWQIHPPALHFYRTHGGREVDFFFHSPQSLLAIEAKPSAKAYPRDARTTDRQRSDLPKRPHPFQISRLYKKNQKL